MTGFPVASSAGAVQGSGYTIQHPGATRSFLTMVGLAHRTAEGIPAPSSREASGVGAPGEAIAVQSAAVTAAGRLLEEARPARQLIDE